MKSWQLHYANAYEQKQMTESAQTRSFVTMRTKTKAENKVMKNVESKNRNCVSHWMKIPLKSFQFLLIHNTAPSLQYKYMRRRDVHFPITDLVKMKKKRERERKNENMLHYYYHVARWTLFECHVLDYHREKLHVLTVETRLSSPLIRRQKKRTHTFETCAVSPTLTHWHEREVFEMRVVFFSSRWKCWSCHMSTSRQPHSQEIIFLSFLLPLKYKKTNRQPEWKRITIFCKCFSQADFTPGIVCSCY